MRLIHLKFAESSNAHAENCRVAAIFQHALLQIMQLHQWHQAASDHLVCRQLPVCMKTLPACQHIVLTAGPSLSGSSLQ